jgi:hypothetical protein
METTASIGLYDVLFQKVEALYFTSVCLSTITVWH